MKQAQAVKEMKDQEALKRQDTTIKRKQTAASGRDKSSLAVTEDLKRPKKVKKKPT
jgi:hypothetical protein